MAEYLIEQIVKSEETQYDGMSESNAIDIFVQDNARNYIFSEVVHVDLLKIALDKRIYNKQWIQETQSIHLLKMLQLVRLLTREQNLLDFLQDDDILIEILSDVLLQTSQKLTSVIEKQDLNLSIDITIEVLSIFKRLLVFNQVYDNIRTLNIFTSIIDLISVNHPLILKTFLDFLYYFFDKAPKSYTTRELYYEDVEDDENDIQNSQLSVVEKHRKREQLEREVELNLRLIFIEEFGQIYYISKLVFIIEKFEIQYKILSINLITKILEFKIISDNFRRIRGVNTLLQQIKNYESFQFIQNEKEKDSNNQNNKNSKQQEYQNLKISILHCMQKFIQRPEVIYDFKVFGIVPQLQSILKSSTNFIEISLCITILTHLVLDDDLSIKIMENGLDSIIKFLINCHPINREKLQFSDIKKEMKQEAIFELELHCFKLLRFLFSIEKNRKIFKSLFPARLFGIFIDIGNFVKSFSKYKVISEEYNNLQENDILFIESSLQQLKSTNTMLTSTIKTQTQLGSYTLIELIGKGAFGTVFLGKKGENKYALKLITQSRKSESQDQLDNNNSNLLEGEPNDEYLQKYFKEVSIYKNLKHPNIVRYYESFLHEDQLCIVMELIEGFNLSELIKIQTEKGVPFQEDQIWKIIIDMCSVLKYLHQDQRILHRDLNPANIMIDSNYNLKLADFGLAKRLSQSFVTMQQSFVGTLAYSSPEIVQNKPYTEKADIWSFGCIIYELIKLKAPFSGNNPLTMAKTIVNQEYQQLEETGEYSKNILEFVKQCLISDQDKRPSVMELLNLITTQLIDRVKNINEKQLQLNEEVINLTQKMNQRKYDTIPKKPIVKIESDNLNKIREDPLSQFLQIIQKISFIANSQTSQKNNFKKFLVDLFYNKVIINLNYNSILLKEEIQKLLNLSKNEITALNIEYDPNLNNQDIQKNAQQNITYEMMYFYIEELFQIQSKQQTNKQK